MAHTLLICQNKACRKAGSGKVLAAFEAEWLPGITVTGCQCLGQCGNGPMVLIMPEQVWYHRVHPDEVAAIAAHLRQGQWISALLYPKFHSS